MKIAGHDLQYSGEGGDGIVAMMADAKAGRLEVVASDGGGGLA